MVGANKAVLTAVRCSVAIAPYVIFKVVCGATVTEFLATQNALGGMTELKRACAIQLLGLIRRLK